MLKVRTLNQYRINLKSLTGVSLVGSTVPLIYSQDGEFLKITLPAKASTGGSPTLNDPIEVLTDGKVVMGFGPIFPNGVNVGMYKLDLASVQPVAQVNTFSAGEGRARQNFLLYGSTAAVDPGWNVTATTVFTPVNGVDTRLVKPTAFETTSIRRSNGRPLGNYRWLVWALSPLEDGIGGGNSSFQELQVIPATKRKYQRW